MELYNEIQGLLNVWHRTRVNLDSFVEIPEIRNESYRTICFGNNEAWRRPFWVSFEYAKKYYFHQPIYLLLCCIILGVGYPLWFSTEGFSIIFQINFDFLANPTVTCISFLYFNGVFLSLYLLLHNRQGLILL